MFRQSKSRQQDATISILQNETQMALASNAVAVFLSECHPWHAMVGMARFHN